MYKATYILGCGKETTTNMGCTFFDTKIVDYTLCKFLLYDYVGKGSDTFILYFTHILGTTLSISFHAHTLPRCHNWSCTVCPMCSILHSSFQGETYHHRRSYIRESPCRYALLQRRLVSMELSLFDSFFITMHKN